MSPLLMLSLALAPAAGPPPAKADPAALVRELGSDKYAARVEAARKLLALGERALPAVEAGWADADLEVRRRCQALLKKLRAAVWPRRVRALQAGRADSSVPLWEHYRRMFGNGREAVALFAEMYAKEHELFDEVALALRYRDHKEASRLHREQVKRASARPLDPIAQERIRGMGLKVPETPPLDTRRLAAALLVGTLPGVELNDEGWQGLTTPLSYHPPFRQEMDRPGARREVFCRLVGRWCLTARSETAMEVALGQALVHHLAEPARTLARRAITRESLLLQALAASALGQHGQKEDIARVLPLLRRKEYCGPSKGGHELADVALVALVRLTRQSPQAYGVVGDDGWRFSRLADREAAFRKWRARAEESSDVVGLMRGAVKGQVGPRLAYEEARDAAVEQFFWGHRLLQWAQRPEYFRPEAFLRLRV
jgi:hypothetical protein